MSSEWYTRPVAVEDVPHLGLVVWPERAPEDILHKIDRLACDLGHRHGLALVACRAGELIAYGQVIRWKRGAEIADLFVTESQRGRGIGSHIIRQLRTHAAGWGVQYVEIGVDAANTGARRLYERLGFVPAYVQNSPDSAVHYLQWRVTPPACQTFYI